MLLLLFTIGCIAAVTFLFWQLKSSDEATARKLNDTAQKEKERS